jgi:hypothetical protein
MKPSNSTSASGASASFDNFSHFWLVEHVPMDKAILRRWLEAGYIDEGSLFETRAGTPQGGVISPVIVNVALDGLEAAVHASAGGCSRRHKRRPAALPRVNGGGHPPCQGARGCASRSTRNGPSNWLVVALRGVPSNCSVPPHGAEEWLEPDAG